MIATRKIAAKIPIITGKAEINPPPITAIFFIFLIFLTVLTAFWAFCTLSATFPTLLPNLVLLNLFLA